MQTALTYSDILKNEFDKKRVKNPGYSLRAFARDLNISNSALSLLMRGKLGLSKKKAAQLSQCLGFSREESLFFTDLIRAKRAKQENTRREAALNLRQYDTRFNSIELASFHLIAKWYSLPVMELIRMYGERANNGFLAKRLGISQEEALNTREALAKLKILEPNRDGYHIAVDFVSLPDGLKPDKQIREFHQAILERAKIAVVKSPKTERHIGCAVVRMRKEDVEWAAKEMRIFRRKLAARIEAGKDHDAIYAVATQLFRLDCEN